MNFKITSALQKTLIVIAANEMKLAHAIFSLNLTHSFLLQSFVVNYFTKQNFLEISFWDIGSLKNGYNHKFSVFTIINLLLLCNRTKH